MKPASWRLSPRITVPEDQERLEAVAEGDRRANLHRVVTLLGDAALDMAFASGPGRKKKRD